MIEEDRIKYANGGANTIISTAGIDISAPKFAELLANNKDVHNFIMETEFSTVEKVFQETQVLIRKFCGKLSTTSNITETVSERIKAMAFSMYS